VIAMNLYRVESQLANLERLVPHLAQHGCNISAQDAARALMRYFDDASHPGNLEDDLLKHENRALLRAYAHLRGRLKDIADGRSGMLPIEQVAAFTRFYREHMLRTESVMVRPASLPAADLLDS
jgi:pyridoxamine 5'-phosphate oxidase